MSRPINSRSRRSLLVIALVFLLVVGAIATLVVLYSSPTLSSADASATAEAQQFATSEVERQSTAVAVRRTSTAAARATGTAEVVARATRAVQSTATEQANVLATGTAAAIASAIAPGTQTAEATDFEQRRTEAETITRRLDSQARQVFGPTSGTLDHKTDGTPTCAETDLAFHNFIASARIFNPYSAAQHPWDHGITFSNEGDDTYYSLVMRSSGDYALKLSGSAFYVETNNSTDLLDLSRPGDNLIKLYINNNVAYLYFNDFYADTLDLRQVNLGQTTARNHRPMLCANLDDGSALEGATTRYEDFTVWSLP